jgi:two-component system NtrC family response regulator/two-component system response regulator HydG
VKDEKARVVVIDDEANAVAALETLLREDGYEVAGAHDARAGLALLERMEADVVLTDLRMPGMDGLELLARVKEIRPETMVIVMTAYGTVKTAVKAMKMGAEDYLGKPIDVEEVELVLQRALEKKRLLEEARILRARVQTKYRFENLVGESPDMLAAFKTIQQVAPSSSSLLILGESGTGKELFAQALHQISPRKNKPFIKVACSALPETLLESELFGHEKGSFTGAAYTRAGRFEMADGGTLFLDEIGDISPTVQIKLLRFLEEREFERVGGNRTFKVDVRIVAATHRDLLKKLAEGTFREDLYYRLNVIEVHIPPLRERAGDIPILATHFLKRYADQNAKDIRGFSDDALALLLRHPWPGNVRELENAVERAVVLATEPILGPAYFPTLRRVADAADAPAGRTSRVSIPGSTMAELEKEAILRTMEAVGGSTARAAELLQISARKIQYKLKEYHQEEPVRTGA